MSAPRPTKLARACAHAHGFALVEVLLVLGVASAMAAAGWLIFGPTSVAADVKQTQLDFSETANAIDRSLGILGGYSGLSSSLVQSDDLAAQRLRQGDALRNVWGGSVSFVANTVRRGNDSFLVETREVPKAACARLVAAMSGDPAVWDAQVDGESVYVGNRYDPATAAAACQAHGGDRMGFVYFSGLASGSSVAVSAIALPPAPVGVTPASPTTPVAPVDGAPSVGDAAPGAAGVVSPGTPAAPPPAVPVAPPAPVVPQTPQPTPAVPPPSTPTVLPVCTVPPTQAQNVNCPAGQVGTVTQQRVGYCGEVGGPYEAWATGVYGPWATVSSTCAPACVAPSSTSVAITRPAPVESQSLGCPTGQTGSIVQQRTRVETGTRTTSWACPAATGSPVSSTSDSWSGTYSAASGWVITSNTCTTPAPPAKTYPSYSGRSWVSWGDGGLYGWGVFCAPSQYYADQTHCTQSVNTNDDATFSPVLPQEQALTSERRSCIAALQQRLSPMPGFGYTPSNGPVDWPSECACEVVGAGSAFYWQVTGASDWSAYEFKCP
ncbi:large tegument protein [Pseudoxanthomonas winnipegensis]|uniref:Large tegument protein n=2 Tax=Lysobacterales TaxID=135614 RepID=A0A4Q8LUF6_9GAMM|nr:large tegument protein [Pseudoxanthomonas winnipegensis]